MPLKAIRIMLSPKMQRSVRVNENQLIMLSDKAQVCNIFLRCSELIPFSVISQYDHSMVSVTFSQFSSFSSPVVI